jgi:hypothetical protein
MMTRAASFFRGTAAPERTPRKEPFGYSDIVSLTWSFQMMQVLVVSVSLLLFAGGVWANIGGGSLSQHTGAWVSHNTK